MLFQDLLKYYDGNMMNIVRGAGYTQACVFKWKERNSIPLDCQCRIQLITNGDLKADVEHDLNIMRKKLERSGDMRYRHIMIRTIEQ